MPGLRWAQVGGSETGLFLIDPAGQAQLIDISNALFSRPDLASVLHRRKIIQQR